MTISPFGRIGAAISTLLFAATGNRQPPAPTVVIRKAAPDNFTALGLLARASHRLQEG